MTHTVSRTHDTLAHVLDAQGRRVSRHDLISDADKEAERLNNLETTMPVETSETPEDLTDPLLPVDTGTDDASTEVVLRYVLRCAKSWVPDARIIGNARAGDIARAVTGVLSANAQLERERDEARKAIARRDQWVETARKERDAAIRERDEARESFELLWRAERERDRLAAVWKDAYAAFIGAFDTPLARRRDNSEFAQDARRRLSEYDHLTPATEAPKDGE